MTTETTAAPAPDNGRDYAGLLALLRAAPTALPVYLDHYHRQLASLEARLAAHGPNSTIQAEIDDIRAHLARMAEIEAALTPPPAGPTGQTP